MTLCWSLDKVGPICRTVEDTALVLNAINGFDEADPGSIGVPLGCESSTDVTGMRVGYDPAWFDNEFATDTDRAALRAVEELGVKLVELSFPDLPYDSFLGVLYAEAAAAFEDLTLTGRDDELSRQDVWAWPNIFRRARFLTAIDQIQLDRLRYRLMVLMDDMFNSVDAMIGPVLPGPMLMITNMTGHPALVLRAGLKESRMRVGPSIWTGRVELERETDEGPKVEVPYGIALYAGLFEERMLFKLGMALQSKLDVYRRRPNLDALESSSASVMQQ
jgi:Asp-tRNA(Asn)/Glu-tRNA(Gln) amidotransferase A subunit family amidase